MKLNYNEIKMRESLASTMKMAQIHLENFKRVVNPTSETTLQRLLCTMANVARKNIDSIIESYSSIYLCVDPSELIFFDKKLETFFSPKSDASPNMSIDTYLHLLQTILQEIQRNENVMTRVEVKDSPGNDERYDIDEVSSNDSANESIKTPHHEENRNCYNGSRFLY